MSANEAVTLMRPGTATPAAAVMSSNLPLAQVPPQLISADLAHEVDVEPTIPVHIRHCDAVAVIVVRRFVGLARVVHDAGC